MKTATQAPPTLFYDGFCFLCSSSAKWLKKLDKKNQIKFSTIQSEQAKTLLQHHDLPPAQLNTVLILHKNKLFEKSEAIFEIFRILGGGWKILLLFRLIPLFVRNKLYDFIATNRYRWFGRKDSCEL